MAGSCHRPQFTVSVVPASQSSTASHATREVSQCYGATWCVISQPVYSLKCAMRCESSHICSPFQERLELPLQPSEKMVLDSTSRQVASGEADSNGHLLTYASSTPMPPIIVATSYRPPTVDMKTSRNGPTNSVSGRLPSSSQHLVGWLERPTPFTGNLPQCSPPSETSRTAPS